MNLILVMAQTLACTLIGQDDRTTVSQSVPGGQEYAISTPVGDLHFDLKNKCEGDDCLADLTFYSAMAQDEVGSTSFKFSKKAKGHVYAEALTGSPDRKKYEIFCEMQ